jgi:hypothetical protein
MNIAGCSLWECQAGNPVQPAKLLKNAAPMLITLSYTASEWAPVQLPCGIAVLPVLPVLHDCTAVLHDPPCDIKNHDNSIDLFIYLIWLSLPAGKETVNTLYGTRVAVLAGDYLFAQSSWLIANLENLEVGFRVQVAMIVGWKH